MKLNEKETKRFWSHVTKTEDCWIWHGCKRYWGYGAFSLRGKLMRAHRVIFAETFGPIPAGKLVLHTCDNPACVNPAHLFIGTNFENMKDCAAKGRMGAQRKNRERGRNIIAALELNPHETKASIARRFGVTRELVSKIYHRKNWNCLREPRE